MTKKKTEPTQKEIREAVNWMNEKRIAKGLKMVDEAIEFYELCSDNDKDREILANHLNEKAKWLISLNRRKRAIA